MKLSPESIYYKHAMTKVPFITLSKHVSSIVLLIKMTYYHETVCIIINSKHISYKSSQSN